MRILDSNYFITSSGAVYSGSKLLKPHINSMGYFVVSVYGKGWRRTMTVHRLLAIAFIPNPKKEKVINHKNGIKTDNRLRNLEWTSQPENIRHSFRVLGRKGGMLGKLSLPSMSKRVAQIKNGKVIKIWRSGAEAKRVGGYENRNISQCCLGKRKSCGGFQWKYV